MRLVSPIRCGKPHYFWLILIFLFYISGQIYAIKHDGTRGQDYERNFGEVLWAAQNPDEAIRTIYAQGRANPPLYPVIASKIFNTVGINSYITPIEAIGLAQLSLHTAAFIALFSLLGKIISSHRIQIACLAFLMFVPFGRITGIVISADSVSVPLFIFYLYGLSLLTKPLHPMHYTAVNLALCLIAVVGVCTKYTFYSLAPATLLWILLLKHHSGISWRKCTISLLLLFAIPLLALYLQLSHNVDGQTRNFEVSRTWVNPLESPYMRLQNLIFPNRHDLQLLHAPPYNQVAVHNQIGPETPHEKWEKYELLQRNYYSYPGLLHLAIYTDIMNIFQNDPVTTPHTLFFGTRNAWHQSLMAISVKTGLLFSILTVIAVPCMLWRVLQSAVTRTHGELMLAAILLTSLAWLGSLIVFFPFVPNVYGHGIWLPRLTAPALFGFFILTFMWADRQLARDRWPLDKLLITAVLFQSALHFAFLWPPENVPQPPAPAAEAYP